MSLLGSPTYRRDFLTTYLFAPRADLSFRPGHNLATFRIRALRGHVNQILLPLLTRRYGFAMFITNRLVDELEHRRASGQILGWKWFEGHCGVKEM